MAVVICPECGDRGNLSCDGEGDKKYYKVQHSYDQGEVKGRISHCYLGKPPIEVTKIEETRTETTIES